jgi:hypothetical protein
MRAYFILAGILLAFFHTSYSCVALVIEPVYSLEARSDTVHKTPMNRVVRCGKAIMGELRVTLDFYEASVS